MRPGENVKLWSNFEPYSSSCLQPILTGAIMALAQRLRSLQGLSSGLRDVSAALGMLPQIVPAALEQSALMRLPSLSPTVDCHQLWHSPARCCLQPHCRRHALHILSFSSGPQSDTNYRDSRHLSSGAAGHSDHFPSACAGVSAHCSVGKRQC